MNAINDMHAGGAAVFYIKHLLLSSLLFIFITYLVIFITVMHEQQIITSDLIFMYLTVYVHT